MKNTIIIIYLKHLFVFFTYKYKTFYIRNVEIKKYLQYYLNKFINIHLKSWELTKLADKLRKKFSSQV